jgi:alginate O-acetyltransferase complex protein AlgJ
MIRIEIPKERRFQCVLYGVGFIFLCVPLFLHLIVIAGAPIPALLSSNYKLHGFTQEKPGSTARSPKSFFNREFQESVEQFAGNNLPLRSLLIRTNNQFYYSILNKCYTYNSSIIAGKEGQLYEYGYISGYNTNRDPGSFRMEDIESSVRKIKQLQDFFRARGQFFFYLITPSKAECYPQFIPERFHCDMSAESIKYKRFVEELDKRGILYVDAFRLTIENRGTYGIPLFPEKGTHWNQLAAAVATREIVELIRKAGGYEVDDFKFGYTVSQEPEGDDADLLNVANLLFRYRYPTARVSIEPNMAGAHLEMASVGGSFLGLPNYFLLKNHFIDTIDYFNYFDNMAFHLLAKRNSIVNLADCPDKRALYAPLLQADIVLLEENVDNVASKNVDKLHAFIFDDGNPAGHARKALKQAAHE